MYRRDIRPLTEETWWHRNHSAHSVTRQSGASHTHSKALRARWFITRTHTLHGHRQSHETRRRVGKPANHCPVRRPDFLSRDSRTQKTATKWPPFSENIRCATSLSHRLYQPSETALAMEMESRSAASARAWRSVICRLGSITMFEAPCTWPFRSSSPELASTV
jgi:hypothetical protein